MIILIASRHRKRSIAFTMLFVWVFALLSGVANACLTEPHDDKAHGGATVSQVDHSALDAPHPHAADQDHHDSHLDKAPCQRSCDESSQTLLKQQPKLDTPDLQAVALPSQAWIVDLLCASDTPGRTHVAAVPPPSPPPRVWFSRLAL
ncbi:hypothetical protein [Piscinibacter gummiphilus]|uniref:Uncharacterized protein n=1 Tax=Piscinibacter gummiphilus TaxID=946333 RepID=A0ABZ0D6M2_9BURK|nr:hypothetical protein [Piscinibacter gummiphilus]WOB10917.1 hypothetical protein RXV79_12885 [Piscinibacter gummiphilus]